MEFEFSEEYARKLDAQDELSSYRQEFIFPQHDGEDAIYFTGNSLGLQPKKAEAALKQELSDWAKYGVEGHFDAKNPWFSYHEMFAEPMSRLVGASPKEVVAMNGLTTNLHLMMVSFYRPSKSRFKILCEAKAFPSDQYAIESQVKFHGLDPEEAIIEIAPRKGEHLVIEEDILRAVKEHGDSIALVMIGGVNYYSGQLFNMEKITRAGQDVGAKVGWDLAHAAGNVVLNLHDWNVDFACWCSYKYLNAGPGSVSGCFVHERHCNDTELVRFAGWWGHEKETRFLMQKGFRPVASAEGWQLSNAPVLAMAVYKVSLDLFDEIGMEKLRSKSEMLTAYQEFVINEVSKSMGEVGFEIITPKKADERGCQLSILAHGFGRPLFDKLTAAGVIADWREPNVIRIAPVPLYNSFLDCFRFGQTLENITSRN